MDASSNVTANNVTCKCDVLKRGLVVILAIQNVSLAVEIRQEAYANFRNFFGHVACVTQVPLHERCQYKSLYGNITNVSAATER